MARLTTSLAFQLLPAAIAAGAAIMKHFNAQTSMEQKADGSPVSAADRDAEEIILAALAEIAPEVPVLAEEAASAGLVAPKGDEFFLVDPLDGTREYAERRPEFTVNIALIRAGTPVFGLIYAPALSQLYWTDDAGAYKAKVAPDETLVDLHQIKGSRLQTRPPHNGPQTIVASRSHGSDALEAWLAHLEVGERVNVGSSLKFCLVAEGKADIYPRFGPTMEWDTAAGHAIVLAAGGSVTGTDGSTFTYGKSECGYLNPGFIVWQGEPQLAHRD